MPSDRFLFTSESVTEGHPDKIADQVSDGVLDTILGQDPEARVACETLVSTGLVFITGEITTQGFVDMQKLARQIVGDIGYTRAHYGLDAETCAVVTSINEQSPDIAQGVDVQGAGDQGLMFGYATDETEELMPYPITLAHRLARRLAHVRKQRTVPYLRPDGKSQVTMEYVDGEPARVEAVVIAAQHAEDVDLETVKEDVQEHVINPVVPEGMLDESTKYYINHTGRFVRGGPFADAGLTGRKIIVDTYGGSAPHGGGAFSGKDPTKVDRSASYAARWAAKNVVAAGLARECQIQLAYSIGHQQPVSIHVDTRGTGEAPDADLGAVVRKAFDFSPAAIIRELGLRRPIYRQVAAYGHFGRPDLDLPWERTDKVDELQQAAGKA